MSQPKPTFDGPSPRSEVNRRLSVANNDNTGGRGRTHTIMSGVFSSKIPMLNATDQIIQEVSNDRTESWLSSFLSLGSESNQAKRIHELLVQSQTEEHEDPDSLFNLVIQGDLQGIKDKIMKERDKGKHNDTDLVSKLDAAGGNTIHAAYLYEQYHIGRWFVENYPNIAIRPFTSEYKDARVKVKKEYMPYTGENILHMTIVRKNIAETRWLLDFYKDHKHSVGDGLEKLLLGNATGKFFSRDGEFYCGSYPLHFAACSNDKAMFDLILAYASAINYHLKVESESNKEAMAPIRGRSDVIFMRDQHGNNCLHLAVIHGLKDIYSHIKDTASNILEKEIRLALADKLNATDEFNDKSEQTVRLTLQPLPTVVGFLHGYPPRESAIIAPQAHISVEAFNVWLREATERKFQERMELVLNEDFHSPLTLCGAIDEYSNFGRAGKDEKYENRSKKGMVAFLISQMKQERWRYGSVNCSLISLEGLEYPYYIESYPTLPPNASSKMFGLIEWICITNSNDSAKIPEVQRIITAKWERYGFKLFKIRFVYHVLLTFLVTLLVVFLNATPDDVTEKSSTLVKGATVLYPLACLLYGLLFLYELRSHRHYGLDYFGFARHSRIRGAARFEKLCKTIIFFSFLALVVCQYTEHQYLESELLKKITIDEGIKISLSICVIFEWLFTYYYLMGFDATGPFVLTIYRIVSRDVPFFVTFYIIVLIAFGCAISLLSNNGSYDAAYGFKHLALTFFDLVQITVNMQQNGQYSSEVDINTVPDDLYWVFQIVFTAFYIIVVLMFGNLLIAMINSTYGILVEHNDELLLVEKYNIMCAMESSMWLRRSRSVPADYSVAVTQNVNRFNNSQQSTEVASENDPSKFQRSSYFSFRESNAASASAKINTGISEIDSATFRDNSDDCLPNYAFEMLTEDQTWWATEKDIDDANAVKYNKVTLLLIMPQNDFHEADGVEGTPGYRPAGSLAVPGSTEDSRRIRDLILRNIDRIDDIIVTLDSHYPTHIAHSIFWRKGPSNPDASSVNIHPANFTVISHSDILEGIWLPVQAGEEVMEWVKYYTKELEKKGKLKLTIWPEHCLIGSTGHAIVAPISSAIEAWCTRRFKTMKCLMKGENLYTEMYSALVAEVEDPSDPKTALDWDLLADLKIADKILICGHALSHCVNFTVMDILKHWHSDPARLHLLRDGCSSVKGYEEVGRRFLDDIQKQGVTVTDCASVVL